MLLFCPNCANVLTIEEANYGYRFACLSCPYIHQITEPVNLATILSWFDDLSLLFSDPEPHLPKTERNRRHFGRSERMGKCSMWRWFFHFFYLLNHFTIECNTFKWLAARTRNAATGGLTFSNCKREAQTNRWPRSTGARNVRIIGKNDWRTHRFASKCKQLYFTNCEFEINLLSNAFANVP